MELLARLAPLVPPPRFPLLRYAGVFAANSPWRPFVVPQPPDVSATCHHAHAGGEPTAPPAPPAPPPSTPA
ncbi:MAG: transposase, partial [Myxococcota bacterium]|nr:transposase [Myxococcota bacterium]